VPDDRLVAVAGEVEDLHLRPLANVELRGLGPLFNGMITSLTPP